MSAVIAFVHVGKIAPLGPDGVPSAFVKMACGESVQVETMGLEGDAQADLSVHGGPEKAVYGYAAAHYPAWAAEWPQHADRFTHGAMGENLTVAGMDEADICVGDVHAIGTARLQVCQPRQPCFKLALHFADNRLPRAMVRSGRAGWYYRVLTPGAVRAGDVVTLYERPNPDFAFARLVAIVNHGGASRDELAQMAAMSGIARQWRVAARICCAEPEEAADRNRLCAGTGLAFLRADSKRGGVAMTRKLAAEFIGTAWLVLGGCGAAVLAAAFPQLGIGFVGVSLAFGLTVLTMAFAIGHVSGCHLNPAVSFGLWAGGRFAARDLPGYIIAQVLGGLAGAGVLYLIASGHAGFDAHAGFASNGYGEHSPGGYSLTAAFVCEVAMTFVFLFVILGSTHGRAPAGFAPIAIGLCLTLIHLISIPVTNTSVNPARSTAPALFQGSWAIDQLWLFWVAPIAGAILAGFVYRWLSPDEPRPVDISGR